jgi:hypothetical protein
VNEGSDGIGGWDPDEPGYGWIFKAWFRDRSTARMAAAEISSAGWEASLSAWGRKVRVRVEDGHEGMRLEQFVRERWPDVREIQIRND